MTIFDILSLIGGLSLFLFGMHLMSDALERSAGGNLKHLLGKMTGNKCLGFLTGAGVTAVIQSSSATTVMVVGFVNSGLMTLRQAINVIMGANVGTTITSWILSLSGIDGNSLFIQLLKPTSFSPVLALVGAGLLMFAKTGKKKDLATILLGFATLMFGMDAMSSAVSGLKDVPAFTQLFIAFQNPLLGMLAGALLTAIIQSSSASVGILQVLAATGQVSFQAAIPIIMGQNIGTCVTAMLSAIGANKNAKRAATVHLAFNIVGAVVWLTVFCIVNAVFAPAIFQTPATMYGIAIVHTVFNLSCTALLLPMGGLLEKLACKIIPDAKTKEHSVKLDERLLATPPVALERCHSLTLAMAHKALSAMQDGISCLESYSAEKAKAVRKAEEKTDEYEDMLGTYLIKLSSRQIGEQSSAEAAELLKMIGDFERIADHACNILESAEEMQSKKIALSEQAKHELSVLTGAVDEILTLCVSAFENGDLTAANQIEPLEQVIDNLRETLRTRHILRMQQGKCSAEAGFVWEDMLINLERVSDHCSNVAVYLIEGKNGNLNLHNSLKKTSPDFQSAFEAFSEKYKLS
ncbi:MAG: Na/Pi cotransporter family protein [Clostridia bacterium]|nr:Na/Pi cotransporter family protein [Clostridia bacterium]